MSLKKDYCVLKRTGMCEFGRSGVNSGCAVKMWGLKEPVWEGFGNVNPLVGKHVPLFRRDESPHVLMSPLRRVCGVNGLVLLASYVG